MPRKRYLSTRASVNRRLGRASSNAALCYLLSIPHGDVCGRISGHPEEYKATICPHRPLSVKRVEHLIAELVEARLYVAWEIDGHKVLAFPEDSWLEYQGSALKDASRPEQPEPPEGVEGALRADFLEGFRTSEKFLPRARACAPSPSPSPSPTPTREGGEEGTDSHLKALRDFPGYEPRDDDTKWLVSLAADYPKVNLVREFHAAADWHEAAPTHKQWKGTSRSVRVGLRNWCKSETEKIEAGRKPAAGTEAEVAQEKQPRRQAKCKYAEGVPDQVEWCPMRTVPTFNDCKDCEKAPAWVKGRKDEVEA